MDRTAKTAPELARPVGDGHGIVCARLTDLETLTMTVHVVGREKPDVLMIEWGTFR
jgi:hypothetical protein